MKRQIPIGRTSTEALMRRAAFAIGVDDVRSGVAPDYDGQDDRYWAYERGRQWACLAPVSMPLKVGDRLNPAAVALCKVAIERGLII